MNSKPIRVRIAPSPTGDPHVGTAYSALFNYIYARSRGGVFVLRIEDTDRTRSTPESEAAILESLRWLGLSWDEGPDVGGPYGPYRQSERGEIYRAQVDRLLELGHAYRCFCSKGRLDRVRAEGHSGYDRHCRDLDPADAADRVARGEEHVVRMKIPLEGDCIMQDLLRGEIRKGWESVDDQVILKSDGRPTYHLANVVDDHLMEITTVIRGEEWINSVPKHLLLYEYLGWDPPVMAHLPLLRNSDKNKTKLSKRKNPTSILYYRDAGYLPEALINFLGLMGWAMPGGEEKFTPEEMAAQFRLEDISLGGPAFDVEKLRWLNGRYIREDYDAEGLFDLLEEWALNPGNLRRMVPLIQPRLTTLADWGRLTGAFFTDEVAWEPGALVLKGKTDDEVAAILQMTLWRMEALVDFTPQGLAALFKDLAGVFGVKLRDFTLPFYVALSGSTVWTPLFDSMAILGPDLVRARIRRAVDALGGGSGKKRKKIEKEYAVLFGDRK